MIIFRETPNYDVIYNKRNDYKTMTRGEVIDHLKANRCISKTLKGQLSKEIATGTLFFSLLPFLIGLPIGVGFALGGGLDWATITWSVTGGIIVAMLGIAGCAALVHYYHRRPQLSEDEFNQLMEEITRLKAEDITVLKNRVERDNKMAQDRQNKIESFEKLRFQTSNEMCQFV